MKNKNYLSLIIIVLALSLPEFVSVSAAQSKQEFAKRRTAVFDKMDDDSYMILRSNSPVNEFGKFRQEDNMFYLTGLNEANSALVLIKSEKVRTRAKEILFIAPSNADRADWDAQTLGLDGAKEKLGFKEVKEYAEFEKYFSRLLLSNPKAIYINIDRSGDLLNPLTSDEVLIKQSKDKGSDFKILSPNNLVYPMRRIKSTEEIQILQKAVDITIEGHEEMMRSVQPGMMEYQIQAIGEYVFRFNGADRVGYGSIVGSGYKGTVLHWDENSQKTKDGDMVVVDMGAEYGLYTADITRSFPVNGKFTDRQKEIYEIVLAANEACIAMIAPGVKISDVSEMASATLANGLIKLGMIKDRSGLRTYYYHGMSHNIGLNVHDVGGMGILEEGMVITIEPGLYVKTENMGIRIEDDVLVTKNGHINMSAKMAKSVKDVEKLLAQKGIEYSRYKIKN